MQNETLPVCPRCGKAARQADAAFCPYCGAPAEEGFAFCRRCGKKLLPVFYGAGAGNQRKAAAADHHAAGVDLAVCLSGLARDEQGHRFAAVFWRVHVFPP